MQQPAMVAKQKASKQQLGLYLFRVQHMSCLVDLLQVSGSGLS